MNAVAAQAEARDRGGFLTVDAFLTIRREDAGVRPLYVLGALFLSIPDHIHDDPLHARLIRLACDLVVIDNVSSSSVPSCHIFAHIQTERCGVHRCRT